MSWDITDILLLVGLAGIGWQVKLFRQDWGSKKKQKGTLFTRLNPWKLPVWLKLMIFPYNSGSKSGPAAIDVARREQKLANAEADKLIEKYKRARSPGFRKKSDTD